MPATPVSPLVRSILNGDVNMPAGEVIKKARAKGSTAPESSIRDAVYNVKSELRKAAAKAGVVPAVPKPAAKPVTTAARATKTPEPAPAPASAAPSLALDLAATLANVALVNTVVGACGGAEAARRVAEAVKACGGVDAFLQHLELVAGIRAGAATS